VLREVSRRNVGAIPTKEKTKQKMSITWGRFLGTVGFCEQGWVSFYKPRLWKMGGLKAIKGFQDEKRDRKRRRANKGRRGRGD